MTEFEFNFINLIKDRKITKKEIAEVLGVTQPTLKSRLNDKSTFRIHEVETLKTKFNINVLEL